MSISRTFCSRVLLSCSLFLASCSGFPGTDEEQVSAEFEDAYAGVYQPSAESPERPRYSFFCVEEGAQTSEIGTSYVVNVEFHAGNSNGLVRASFPLEFRPTAIYGPSGRHDVIFLGGRSDSGLVVLREIFFEFEFEKGTVRVGFDRKFAGASSLGSVSDILLCEESVNGSLFVLDGRNGDFGVIKRGKSFKSLIPSSYSKYLKGRHSMFEVFPGERNRVYGFSSRTPIESGHEDISELFLLEEFVRHSLYSQRLPK